MQPWFIAYDADTAGLSGLSVATVRMGPLTLEFRDSSAAVAKMDRRIATFMTRPWPLT